MKDTGKYWYKNMFQCSSGLKSDTESSTEKTTEKTTEKILTTITKNPYITQSELAKICGITEDGIYWNIKRLKEEGIIRRIGPNKRRTLGDCK